MDAEISRQRKSSGYTGHAEDFRRGLVIDFISLDLASMESVFMFAEEAQRQYGLHFICVIKISTVNAGTLTFLT